MNKLNEEYSDYEKNLYFVFIEDGKIYFEENINDYDLEEIIIWNEMEAFNGGVIYENIENR